MRRRRQPACLRASRPSRSRPPGGTALRSSDHSRRAIGSPPPRRGRATVPCRPVPDSGERPAPPRCGGCNGSCDRSATPAAPWTGCSAPARRRGAAGRGPGVLAGAHAPGQRPACASGGDAVGRAGQRPASASGRDAVARRAGPAARWPRARRRADRAAPRGRDRPPLAAADGRVAALVADPRVVRRRAARASPPVGAGAPEAHEGGSGATSRRTWPILISRRSPSLPSGTVRAACRRRRRMRAPATRLPAAGKPTAGIGGARYEGLTLA
jgi:hypothetical protein